MGGVIPRDPQGHCPCSSELHAAEYQKLQVAKAQGRAVLPPLPDVDWTEDLLFEVEQPTDWFDVVEPDWCISFKHPSSWNLAVPIIEGDRLTRAVRAGYRHKESHIFCVCELAVVVTKLSQEFLTEEDFFEQVRLANAASKPTTHQESFGFVEDRKALMSANTYLQPDGSSTRIIDKHCFLPRPRLGISVVAFFADAEVYFSRFRRTANAFFESVHVIAPSPTTQA